MQVTMLLDKDIVNERRVVSVVFFTFRRVFMCVTCRERAPAKVVTTEKVSFGRCARLRAGAAIGRTPGARVITADQGPHRARSTRARGSGITLDFQRRDANGVIALLERLLHMSPTLCERLLHMSRFRERAVDRSAPARLEGQCRGIE